MNYRLSSLAENDLISIWSFIASDNIGAADRVELAILDACIFLAKAPMRGHMRQDITTLQVRFWTVSRFPAYLIVYNPATNPLKIIRILHEARNVSRQLKTPE